MLVSICIDITDASTQHVYKHTFVYKHIVSDKNKIKLKNQNKQKTKNMHIRTSLQKLFFFVCVLYRFAR